MKKDSVGILLVPPHFLDPTILTEPKPIVEKPLEFKIIDKLSIKY